MIGKWFGKKVAKKLADEVFPDAARAAEKPIRQVEEPLTEFARKTVTDRDLEGRHQIEQSGVGESSHATPAPLDPSPRSSADFTPGMSGQQVRETVAGLLRDHGAAGASARLPDLAALPVNYGLKASGKEGVHLSLTTQHSGTGSIVSGSVEGFRPEVDRSGILADNWGGEQFGKFEYKDPGDGTDPSWSIQLPTDRKRIGRVADSLPDQLASLAPDFGMDRVRSTVTEAVELAAQHKELRRGATLAAETTAGQLRVRAWKGVLPANMTPPDWVLFDRTIARD
ncbi:hypothetical protein [Nocardia sp. CY41]|uniref:hypothetical protein n=1 Tax=Nocardia sp. CY41 TaxID=2608686 RepID=UPI00135A08DA|nr:hypothetical protein [Nocardia sp. CY41]